MTTEAHRLETFSYLPPMTMQQISAQIASMLERGLVPSVEHSSDPGPGASYWSLWRLPMFDARTPEDVVTEVDACASANPGAYVRVIGYDAKRGGQAAAFVVRRPAKTA